MIRILENFFDGLIAWAERHPRAMYALAGLVVIAAALQAVAYAMSV